MYLSQLQKELDEPEIGTTIHICVYQINREKQLPFLQYFLLKHTETNEMYFPSFKYDYYQDPILDLAHQIISIFFECFLLGTPVYNYKGLLRQEGGKDIYLFFESKLLIQSHILYAHNDVWLSLLDEIVNRKEVHDYPVKETVTNLFLSNTELLFLKDEQGNNIEIPTAAYARCSTERMKFIGTFGVLRELLPSDNCNILGHYATHYYFSSSHEYREPDESIVRFAIFTQNMTTDAEEFKEKYDTLYLVNENWKNTYWIVKEYNQQIPLSMHP